MVVVVAAVLDLLRVRMAWVPLFFPLEGPFVVGMNEGAAGESAGGGAVVVVGVIVWVVVVVVVVDVVDSSCHQHWLAHSRYCVVVVEGGGGGPTHTASKPVPIHRPRVGATPFTSSFLGAIWLYMGFSVHGTCTAVIAFHSSRSWAMTMISCRERCWGVSMNRPPSLSMYACRIAARRSRRSGCRRRMWPNHRILVSRIAATRSNVRVLLLASSWMVRPVILLKQRELAPFSAARVRSFRLQASLP